jgi:hypothetical protein
MVRVPEPVVFLVSVDEEGVRQVALHNDRLFFGDLTVFTPSPGLFAKTNS